MSLQQKVIAVLLLACGTLVAFAVPPSRRDVTVVDVHTVQIGDTKIQLPWDWFLTKTQDGTVILNQQALVCGEEQVVLLQNGMPTCMVLATKDGVPVVALQPVRPVQKY